MKIAMRADVLTQCYNREGTYLCPNNVLQHSEDSAWIGINWTPRSKFNFPSNHVPIECDGFRKIIHLGGRYYLSTMEQQIKLNTRTIRMTPLTVYHIPCNETAHSLPSSFVECPQTLTKHLIASMVP